ncbi:sodium/proline symporter [Thiomicrorhabdus heinhorstiae]|uniref:Sodium/proline symporter n=1 Tax=Thiomicrorhabdus heinhorstiae TaxID=2748010 RepID=A0ABS0C391_9GAMM|nr:sodium/proline symporter [Thiomicrorhabdus heinhorstiae]MBF6058742.1 sodium/proline symporter [Thiomicrorhabdus heinhorstiae]
MIYSSFLGFLGLFLLIGVASYLVREKTTSDYLLAGRKVHPALVGLSAVATNNSGFMFIGMIGATYTMGLSSIWLMIGWILGDYWVQRRALYGIQQSSHRNEVHSFGGLIADRLTGNPQKIRFMIGVLILLFLTVYAAAQLKAGTKATQTLLGWSEQIGIITAAAIIFIYSLLGGLRASIWTDAAQSTVMLLGMALLVVFGYSQIGGITPLLQALNSVSDNYMSLFPPETAILGSILFIVGWFFGGMGVIGQPHIVIRFMTLDPSRRVSEMQSYYYFWFITFYALTICAGLISRVLIPSADAFDSETALPVLASQLMPELFVGLILAALFAATMSTVDSLVLSCSATLSRDLIPQWRHSLLLTKLSTFIVLLTATIIALSNQKTVFELVLDAWGLLASAFGSLIYWVARHYDDEVHLRQSAVFGAVFSGLLVFWLAGQTSSLAQLYPAAAGMLASFITLLVLQNRQSTS